VHLREALNLAGAALRNPSGKFAQHVFRPFRLLARETASLQLLSEIAVRLGSLTAKFLHAQRTEPYPELGDMP
jgi:hypothetical protein